MQKKNDNIQLRREAGQSLYNDLLNKIHKGNVDDMFKYFKDRVQYIDAYGDNPEQKMINYCTFKYEATLNMYNALNKR